MVDRPNVLNKFTYFRASYRNITKFAFSEWRQPEMGVVLFCFHCWKKQKTIVIEDVGHDMMTY